MYILYIWHIHNILHILQIHRVMYILHILHIENIFCRVSTGTPRSRQIVVLEMDSQAPIPENEENDSARKRRETNADGLLLTKSVRVSVGRNNINANYKILTDCWAGHSPLDKRAD